MGSNRRFGLVLAAACAIVYGVGYWYDSAHPRWLVAAAIFLLIAVVIPRVLEPLKKLWLKFGGLLHVVVSPALLILFYYLAVTPIGLVIQLLGMDPLRLKRKNQSYWIERQPPGPKPDTMNELF